MGGWGELQECQGGRERRVIYCNIQNAGGGGRTYSISEVMDARRYLGWHTRHSRAWPCLSTPITCALPVHLPPPPPTRPLHVLCPFTFPQLPVTCVLGVFPTTCAHKRRLAHYLCSVVISVRYQIINIKDVTEDINTSISKAIVIKNRKWNIFYVTIFF